MAEETRKAETEIKVQEIRPELKRRSGADVVKFLDNFGDNVEIYPDAPLPEYDSGPVKAYQARGIEQGVSDYFALVCEKHLMPRAYAATAYKNLTSICAISLVTHGVAYWPPARSERYIFLYRQLGGKRIHKKGDDVALGWKQDAVMTTVVKPMVDLLKEMRDASFTHGAIRPSNMFAVMTSGKPEQLSLGDCLSLPPSYLQPVLYEPIERSLAHPIARGAGTIADDIYSFGVSLAVILRTHDPLQGKSDHEIIREKMEHGSYAAITGKDRFKGSILELLRGLLHDDAKERWTIEEIMTWLDGRRLSPKQALKLKKAARPITYDGRKYLYAPMLAMDIDSNLGETLRIVDGGDLDHWLECSLEDETMTEQIEGLVLQAREKGTGPGYEERLVSNLSVALDPVAPIRYKGLRLMGDGIGTAMSEAIALRHDIQRFVEIFSQGVAFNWLTNTKNVSLDTGSLIARFDHCRNYIRHGKAGYGIERCIYTLCPEAPCFSDKLKDYYVMTPEQMIRAFEDMCIKGAPPTLFLDRHSMAFLSVKEPKVIDAFLFDLGSNEDHRKVLGNLRSMGAIQKRFALPMFPGIGKVVAEALPAVYARYHDREVRGKLETAVKKYAAEGDISKMATLLSNPDLANNDFTSFRIAMREYAELSREHSNLELRLDDRRSFGKTTGKEFAAIVSSVIAAAIILVTAFMFIAGHSGPTF